MSNVDLSKYNQLEQLSKDQLDSLNESILSVINDSYTVENIFIVGSFVFGLDKVNDIDIIVCIKEHVVQDSLEPDNVELYREFDTDFSNVLGIMLNKKIHMLPYNIIDFMTNEAKQVNPPMYDLTNRIWINKEPGVVFPYHLATLDTGKVVLIERDGYSCEGKTCTCD